ARIPAVRAAAERAGYGRRAAVVARAVALVVDTSSGAKVEAYDARGRAVLDDTLPAELAGMRIELHRTIAAQLVPANPTPGRPRRGSERRVISRRPRETFSGCGANPVSSTFGTVLPVQQSRTLGAFGREPRRPNRT